MMAKEGRLATLSTVSRVFNCCGSNTYFHVVIGRRRYPCWRPYVTLREGRPTFLKGVECDRRQCACTQEDVGRVEDQLLQFVGGEDHAIDW